MPNTTNLRLSIWMRRFLPALLPLFFVPVALGQPYYEDAGWAEHGELTYTAFGWSLNNAGDVNGDGYVDMLITAIDYSNPEETDGEEGKIYIYYGSADGLSDTPGFEYETNNDSIVLGFSSDGGDLNGDGFSDIAVGCIQYTDGEWSEGRIYFWYGSPTGPNPAGPDWTIEANQVAALMGSSVALEGDINSDGYNDLFFSAKSWDGGEIDEGKTWMYWGSPDGPVESGWTWEADQAGTISGYPVNYAGDVNGDGYDDVVIGANRYDYATFDDGMAVCFYGSPTGLSATPDWDATSGQNKANFGHWVDGAGDVNGDGYDDVMVSALTYESEVINQNEGRVFVFLGSPDGLEETYVWYGDINQAGANLGYSCAGAGDIDNDGYDDIIAGAKYYDDGDEDEGTAFVWFGSSEGPEIDYCWYGQGNDDFGYYGEHVNGNGDFNDDGYADFMVGAYRFSDSLEADGKAFVYYGAPREYAFHYTQDTFCIDGENPFPIIDGMSGGTFSSDDASVNPSTGEIDLMASGDGWKTIYYESFGLCPTGSFKLFIENSTVDEEFFDFEETHYCVSGADPIPDMLTEYDGYFYSTDAVVNAVSGAVDLDATGYGGPYTIYFMVTTASGCELITSDSIWIDYNASFYYEKDTFCIYEADPFPVIDDVAEGSFTSDDCVVNAGNGKINLVASGTGGPFTIYYMSDNACPDDAFNVWILDIDSAAADFHYATDSFCLSDENPLAIIDGLSGGAFYADAAVVDPITGEIDLTATGDGTFEIHYTVQDIGGCELDYAFTVTISYIDAAFNYDAGTYFQDETDPTPDMIDPSGTYYAMPDGLVFSDVSGTIDLGSSTPGSYMIYHLVDNGACIAIDSFAVEIFAPCAAPLEVVIDNLSSTTAQVSWSGDAYYSDYNVYLVSEADSVLYVVNDDTTISFTDLIPQAAYTVYVFTLCPGDSVGTPESVDFTLPVGIHDLALHNEVLIYPNPAGDFFTVQIDGLMADAEILLFNSDGQLIYNSTGQFYNNDEQLITTADFPAGVYMVKIICNEFVYTAPLIINK